MPEPLLEQVFKLSGIPTYTFVKPVEYQELLVSLRTPGRGLVVEGPSGIGKTTSVTMALEELGIRGKVTKLSARRSEDRTAISALPHQKANGLVIIDDFHRLGEAVRREIADYMKTLADEEDETSKIVIVGINKAGDSLVSFARDLNNRIDTIRFEANPDKRVLELIEKGERALNVNFSAKSGLVQDAHGSFHIAQMLCHRACILSRLTERSEEACRIEVSIDVVRERIQEDLGRSFFEIARRFARGLSFRREGRAPYLQILHWLARSNEWSLQLDQAIAEHPDLKGSVGQVVDKGYLETFLNNDEEFSDVLHYEPQTNILSAEDPKFVYFLRNLLWSKFARQAGFLSIEFDSRYDFALSFAGQDRRIAQAIFTGLQAAEVEVFFDENEEHRILATNLEDYLGPIYRSEAKFIVVLLGPHYPERVWTRFESAQFRDRFGDGSVIPILFSDAMPGIFDPVKNIGAYVFDRNSDSAPQVAKIVEMLLMKLTDYRVGSNPAAAAGENEN